MTSPQILEDFVDVPEFAAQLKRHVRTVRRMMNMPNGLPYTRFGDKILIHIPTAREWLLSGIKRPNPKRNHTVSS
jgi:hypothetical protein